MTLNLLKKRLKVISVLTEVQNVSFDLKNLLTSQTTHTSRYAR